MRTEPNTFWWTVVMTVLVVLAGAALSLYVHNSTNQVREALAEEVLEQQHDVAALIHEYAEVLLALERERMDPTPVSRDRVQSALGAANRQLLLMRSNYSFERLDGAAKAHAFVKPVLEDVEHWLAEGLPGAEREGRIVLEMAVKRLDDRYRKLRLIESETEEVATSLIAAQSANLERFRSSLILLLLAYALIALGIATLLLRQRNLQALLASEQVHHAQRFRDFADTGADWLWETDADFKLIDSTRGGVNQSPLLKAVDEPAAASAAGQNLPRFSGLLANSATSHWPLERMQQHQRFGNVEIEWNDADSDRKVISLSGKPLFDAHGHLLGYRGVGRDITARKRIELELEKANRSLIEAETRGRKQAEKALRGSEQFLRSTLDALSSEIAILDSSGSIIAANLAWKHFVANDQSELIEGGIGQSYQQVFAARAPAEFEQIDIVATAIKDVLMGHRDALNHEYPAHEGDEQRWVVVALTTFHVGEERYAVLVREDVTERRQLEERDRRLRAELAHAARLSTVGEMATGLAHELNQPLTAIGHNCDALLSSVKEQSSPDDELVDIAKDIYQQAQHAGSIIRSLRQLMKKDTVYTTSVGFNELVQETVRLTHPEAREQGVDVTLNLADDLPNPEIDPVQIQQVLVNLERNGVESMGNSAHSNRQLIISTELENENAIRVSVRDSGPGFDKDIRENLFSAFQTTKKNGMGLGLSISRTIVESHGGRLWLDHSPDGGATLCFTLPIRRG